VPHRRTVNRPWIFTLVGLTTLVLAFGLPYIISKEWAYYFYLDLSSVGLEARFLIMQVRAGNLLPAWNSVDSAPFSFLLNMPLVDALLYQVTGSVEISAKVEQVLVVWIAVISAYLLVRWYTHSEVASAVGGVLYGFSPFLMAAVTYNPPMWGWSVLPLGLLSIERTFDRPTVANLLLASVVLAFCLGTFPQNGYLLGLVYVALVVFRILPVQGKNRIWMVRRVYVAIGLLILTIVIAAPDMYLLLVSRAYPAPFDSAMRYVHYSNPTNLNYYSNTFVEALQLLDKEALAWLSSYNGFRLTPAYEFWSMLPAIMFAAFLVLIRPGKVKSFYALLAIFLIVVSTGTKYGAWSVLSELRLPYFDLVSEPTRFLIGASLSLSVVIGFGVSDLISGRDLISIRIWPESLRTKRVWKRYVLAALMLAITLAYSISPVTQTWSTFEGRNAPLDIMTSQQFFTHADDTYRVFDAASPLGSGNFYSYGTASYWNWYDLAQRYGDKPYFADLLGELGYKYVLYSPSTAFSPYGGPNDFYSSLYQSNQVSMRELYSYTHDECIGLDPENVLIRNATDLLGANWFVASNESYAKPLITLDNGMIEFSAEANGAGNTHFVRYLEEPIDITHEDLIRITFRVVGYASQLEVLLGDSKNLTVADETLSGQETVSGSYNSEFVTYLIPLPKSLTWNLTRIVLALSSRFEGYVGPVEIDVRDLSLVRLNPILSYGATPVIEFYGSPTRHEARLSAFFDPNYSGQAFIQIGLPGLSLSPSACLVLKGTISDPQTILSVQIRYKDGSLSESTITAKAVPEAVQSRIYVSSSKQVSQVNLVVKGATQDVHGYHTASIKDSNLYLFEIQDPRPKLSESQGLYVVGGPDAYAYLGIPRFNGSALVPIFSDLTSLEPDDLQRYSALLLHNTDVMDLAVMLANQTNRIELWQHVKPEFSDSYEIYPYFSTIPIHYANDWELYRRFIAFQYGSQVQHTAYGQLVFSTYAVATDSASALELPTKVGHSGEYRLVVRLMPLEAEAQPLQVRIEIDGNLITRSIPNGRFSAIDLGKWNLSAGNHTVTISKAGEGRLLGDYLAFIPEAEWQTSLLRVGDLLENYNGSIVLLYGATTTDTTNASFLSLPLELTDTAVQIWPKTTLDYKLIIPKSGNYYLYAHSLVASTTLQAEVADNFGTLTNVSLREVEKSDTTWEWSVSGSTYLKAGSYTLRLHNLGPSSTILDMYGLVMLKPLDSGMNQVSIIRQTSDHLSAYPIDSKSFILLTETFNEGWSARSGDRVLEHLPGFFFLNAFYTGDVHTNTIDVSFRPDALVGPLILVREVAIAGLVAIVLLDAVKKWNLTRNVRRTTVHVVL